MKKNSRATRGFFKIKMELAIARTNLVWRKCRRNARRKTRRAPFFRFGSARKNPPLHIAKNFDGAFVWGVLVRAKRAFAFCICILHLFDCDIGVCRLSQHWELQICTFVLNSRQFFCFDLAIGAKFVCWYQFRRLTKLVCWFV